MNHFKGVIAEENWKNELLYIQREILNELRLIRESLGRDSKTAQPEPIKRKYTKRGA